MGTGKLGYPRDIVAKHMYTSVEQFASQNQSSNVTEVLFVLYDKDTLTVKVKYTNAFNFHSWLYFKKLATTIRFSLTNSKV